MPTKKWYYQMEVAGLFRRLGGKKKVAEMALQYDNENHFANYLFDEIEKWQDELFTKYTEVGEVDFDDLWDRLYNFNYKKGEQK